MSIWDYVLTTGMHPRGEVDKLREQSKKQHLRTSLRRRSSNKKITDLNERVEELEEEVGSLQLISRALIALLKENKDWDEEKFKQIIYEFDMEDGQLDGR